MDLAALNACEAVDEDSRGLRVRRQPATRRKRMAREKGKGRWSAYFHPAASIVNAKIHFPSKCRRGRRPPQLLVVIFYMRNAREDISIHKFSAREKVGGGLCAVAHVDADDDASSRRARESVR